MRSCNLFTKLKLCGTILSLTGTKKPVLFMTCGKCGGVMIKPQKNSIVDSNTDKNIIKPNHNGVKRTWGEGCICLSCGATCVEVQYWKW